MRDLVAARAPLPVDEAVALIRKIADGLAYSHDHDVVHRDLKPENILITPDGQPIIMDFGLALTKGGQRVTYANLSATAGTPEYMAPEQVEGKRGDPRTDLYAIGVMLYELLAGQPPFRGRRVPGAGSLALPSGAGTISRRPGADAWSLFPAQAGA